MLLEPGVGLKSLLDHISKPSAPLLQAALESAAHSDIDGAGIPLWCAECLDGKENTPPHPHASPEWRVLGWSHELEPLTPLTHDQSLCVFSPLFLARRSALPSPDDHSSAGASTCSISVLETGPQMLMLPLAGEMCVCTCLTDIGAGPCSWMYLTLSGLTSRALATLSPP